MDITNHSAPEMGAWKKDNNNRDMWRREILDPTVDFHDYVVQYGPFGDYNWQSWRRDCAVSGSAPTCATAMEEAERHHAMSHADFFALVIPRIEAEITDLERKLAGTGFTSEKLSGYHAGFAAGFDEAKRRIEAALTVEEDGGDHA